MGEADYRSRAERRRDGGHEGSGNRTRALAALAALVALGGGTALAWSSVRHDSVTAAKPTADKCAAATVPVAVDPSLSDSITHALEGYSGAADAQGCKRTFRVNAITNDDQLNQMKSGAPSNVIWITDSPSWYEKASKITGANISGGEPFASTPVVISGPSDMVDKLGSLDAPWSKAMSATPPLTVDDVTTDRASALAVTMASEAMGNSDTAKAAFGVLATTTRSTIPNDALHVTTEAHAAEFNAANPDTKVAIKPLEGGSPLVQLTAAKLVSGDHQTDAAYNELTSYLLSDAGGQALAASGYRNGDGTRIPSSAPIGASGITVAPTPSEGSVNAMFAKWSATSKPVRLLVVIDVSGSMNTKEGDMRRIDLVAASAKDGLGQFPAKSYVSLWEFSTARDGTKDYKQLVDYGEPTDPAHQERLAQGIERLTTNVKGDTGLYDTVWAAYQRAQSDHQDGARSQVSIITDGKNDDTTGGLSLEELKQKLEEANDPKRPVSLNIVAIGNDPDDKPLKEIVALTQGHVYSVKKTTDLGAVTAQSMVQ